MLGETHGDVKVRLLECGRRSVSTFIMGPSWDSEWPVWMGLGIKFVEVEFRTDLGRSFLDPLDPRTLWGRSQAALGRSSGHSLFLPFTTSLTHFPPLALVCGSVVSDCSSFFLGSGMSCVRGCLQWARRFAPPFFSFSFLDFQAVFACAYAVSFRTWTVYLVCSILVVANIRPVYQKKWERRHDSAVSSEEASVAQFSLEYGGQRRIVRVLP